MSTLVDTAASPAPAGSCGSRCAWTGCARSSGRSRSPGSRRCRWPPITALYSSADSRQVGRSWPGLRGDGPGRPGFRLDDYTVGAMTANELGLWLMVPVGIMALLAVTRRLRAAEEDGRLELVRSAPVGRDAPVVAGLVAAVVATLAVGP